MSFSFSIKKASEPAKPSAADSAAAAKAAPAAAAKAPLSVFKEALEAEEERAKQEAVKPTLSTFSRKTERKEKEKINELLQENPNALSYDEVYEHVSSGSAKEQQRKAQSRRLYLGYTEDIKDKIQKDEATADALAAAAGASPGSGGPQRTQGSPQPRFIGKLLVQAQRRQIEREIIQERQLQKEREREGGATDEVFVTSAYRARLEERQKVQQELERQEARDAARAAEKQNDLFSFHAYLLKSGAATRSAAAPTPPPAAAAAAAAAAPVVKPDTSPAVKLKAESPASPQQQEQQQKQQEESKEEPPFSSSSSKSPIDKDAVLPFKRSAEPKTLPVPDKLSSKDLASARARYLQRKKLKTED